MIAAISVDIGILLLMLALWTVVVRDTFAAVAGFIPYGLLLTLAWLVLRAVDVALTEAAIGAGLTGALLIKYAARDLLAGDLASALAAASSAATTLLMLHFVRCLSATAAADSHARTATPLTVAWLAMVLVSLIGPRVLYLHLPVGTLPEAFAPAALWPALWPVLAGAVLAIGWH